MAQVSEPQNAAAAAPNGNADGVAAITEALEATNLELGRKVFVGNLNFTTKEDQLREIFRKHGTISDVQIILRGSRSLGYGFVTFENTDDAEKAVATTDKTEIEGRQVNVEIAKPAPGTPGGPVPRAAGRGAKKSGATNGGEPSEEDKENQTDDPARSSRRRNGRGRGRGRFRNGRTRRPAESKGEQEGEEPAEDGVSSPAIEGETTPATGRRGRGGRRPGGRSEGRTRREGPPEGEPSKTLLFVANLPFNLTDDGLKDFFAAYEVTSAHVVRRKYGTAQGKSKGFGFVEFANEEVQLKALEESQGKEMNGRALHIKVAVNEQKKEEEAEAEAEAEAENANAAAAGGEA